MDKPIQGFAGCTVNEHGEVKTASCKSPLQTDAATSKYFYRRREGNVPPDPSTGSWRALSLIIRRGSRSSII